MNRQIRLKSRPTGPPSPANFEAIDAPMPSLPDVAGGGDGGVLRRTLWLSLDPYMRGRMSDAPSYAAPVPIGGTMCGHTVSEVVESQNPSFRPGDLVAGYDGWQQFAVSNGSDLRKLDHSFPASAALSVLGMPGLTAYVGLLDIGQPRPGETVVVSAASGAVGSVVGQLAKIKGCRAVGIAGTAEKCRYVVGELGFDACVNYRSEDFAGALAAACPAGIDVDFENVGGTVMSVVLRLLNRGARVPLCGLIAEYNLEARGSGSGTPQSTGGGPNLRPLLVSRALIKGFIVSDHNDRAPAFLQEMVPLVREGRIRYREDVVEGLDAAPAAFIGLLEGRNFGKLLVRVAPAP
jgi:NADPH-dependent curcumin reductase CurA